MKPPSPSLYLFLTLGFLLSGCTGLDVLEPRPDPTRFYSLRAEVLPSVEASDSSIAIGIGPTSIAGYLDRSAIVIDGGNNQLIYKSTDRWAEPLEESIGRFMTQHLSALLGTETVGLTRILGAANCDFRFGYTINRLDGAAGGPVKLDVSWWIKDRNGVDLFFGHDRISGNANIEAGDIRAYVDGMEWVLHEWAVIVAGKIGHLAGEA